MNEHQNPLTIWPNTDLRSSPPDFGFSSTWWDLSSCINKVSKALRVLLKGPHFQNPRTKLTRVTLFSEGSILSSVNHPQHFLWSTCLHPDFKYFHVHYSPVLEGI